MNFMKLAARLRHLNPRLAAWLERQAQAIPPVQAKLEEQYTDLLHDLEASVKPYGAEFARLHTSARDRLRPRRDHCRDGSAV